MKQITEHLVVRYIISGATSALVNLATFFICNHILKIYYITSSIIAFVFAFFVSLVLQKLWTFRDHSHKNIHIQVGKYILTSLFGLGINTIILYICVDFFGVVPFFGQVIAGGLTAFCTFQISNRYVFKNQTDEKLT